MLDHFIQSYQKLYAFLEKENAMIKQNQLYAVLEIAPLKAELWNNYWNHFEALLKRQIIGERNKQIILQYMRQLAPVAEENEKLTAEVVEGYDRTIKNFIRKLTNEHTTETHNYNRNARLKCGYKTSAAFAGRPSVLAVNQVL